MLWYSLDVTTMLLGPIWWKLDGGNMCDTLKEEISCNFLVQIDSEFYGILVILRWFWSNTLHRENIRRLWDATVQNEVLFTLILIEIICKMNNNDVFYLNWAWQTTLSTVSDEMTNWRASSPFEIPCNWNKSTR